MGMISVIIPTLNAENELPELILSLKMQRRPADKILVIDSESEDGTVDICRKNDVRLIQIKR